MAVWSVTSGPGSSSTLATLLQFIIRFRERCVWDGCFNLAHAGIFVCIRPQHVPNEISWFSFWKCKQPSRLNETEDEGMNCKRILHCEIYLRWCLRSVFLPVSFISICSVISIHPIHHYTSFVASQGIPVPMHSSGLNQMPCEVCLASKEKNKCTSHRNIQWTWTVFLSDLMLPPEWE